MRVLCLALVMMTACGSCYHLPTWKGDVQVTPLERKAIKTCGDGALTTAGTQRITREPYLQSTTTSSTVIAWGSKDARGEVVLSEPGGAIIQRATATYVGERDKQARRRAAQRTTEPVAADDMYIVAAPLTKLEPSRLYCYQVFVDGVPLTELAPMRTAAAPGADEPVRFVAVGDSGNNSLAQHAIAKRMTETPFDFLVFMGDIAYRSGKAAELHGNFFAVYKHLLRYVPAYPSIGNHERRTNKGRPYFDAFVLPQPERYYSFNWGDVHFVAIDTTKRDSAQLRWLDNDLRNNKQRWTIVYGHHPMYTNSLRGPQLPIRKAFAKIFTAHQVDLVVTGHEHHYERFRVGGVNYVVSGGGGARLTKFFGHSLALKQATVHHYLAFEATANALTMKAIDINGNEIESLKLDKKPAGDVKIKVDGKPDERITPVPPEKEVKPDEKLHDGPDDDVHKKEVPPPPEEPTPIEVKPTTSAAR